jgi:hypothetical protein
MKTGKVLLCYKGAVLGIFLDIEGAYDNTSLIPLLQLPESMDMRKPLVDRLCLCLKADCIIGGSIAAQVVEGCFEEGLCFCFCGV